MKTPAGITARRAGRVARALCMALLAVVVWLARAVWALGRRTVGATRWVSARVRRRKERAEAAAKQREAAREAALALDRLQNLASLGDVRGSLMLVRRRVADLQKTLPVAPSSASNAPAKGPVESATVAHIAAAERCARQLHLAAQMLHQELAASDGDDAGADGPKVPPEFLQWVECSTVRQLEHLRQAIAAIGPTAGAL